ncbi:MAG: hypothetical protein KAQ92_00275 [Candidatus Aenigmarchaeota archaeon]|nr:hypothetical protein [Candidatus Aenigmarchaeota archaeon]
MKIPSFFYALKSLDDKEKILFEHKSLLCIEEKKISQLKYLIKQNKITMCEKTTQHNIVQNEKYIYFNLKKNIEENEKKNVVQINNEIRAFIQEIVLDKIEDRQKTFIKIFDNVHGFNEIKKALILQYFNPSFSIALLCHDKDVYDEFYNILLSLNIAVTDKWGKSAERELKEMEDKPKVFFGLIKESLSKELKKYANSGLNDYFDLIFVLEKYKKEDFEKIAKLFLKNDKKTSNIEDLKLLELAKKLAVTPDLKDLFSEKKYMDTIISFVSEMKENEEKYYFKVSIDSINTIKQILIAQLILNDKDELQESEIWNAIEIISFSNFKIL